MSVSQSGTVCLPRVRGDRPPWISADVWMGASPPRTRGSTLASHRLCASVVVSPAYAGIDPSKIILYMLAIRLPRVRGDRPLALCCRAWPRQSPPRTRGSTWPCIGQLPRIDVSPAYAGIDLQEGLREQWKQCLPRVRGDRPDGKKMFSAEQMSPPRTRGSTLCQEVIHGADVVSPAYAGIDLFPAAG